MQTGEERSQPLRNTHADRDNDVSCETVQLMQEENMENHLLPEVK